MSDHYGQRYEACWTYTHSDVRRPVQRIFLKTEEGRVLGVRPTRPKEVMAYA